MTEHLGDRPASSFLDSLGPRGRRRAEPRTSIAIAAAGCALAILGVLIVAGDTGAGDDEFNKVPGIVLSALVVAAGYAVLRAVRQGAMATAGTVATALGVPSFLFFLTFDEGSLPPYSTDAILIVSTLVWLVAYAAGAGRGRPFLLGAGLVGAWLTALQLVEDVFDAPFGFVGELSFETRLDSSSGEVLEPTFGPAADFPDPTTLGVLSLAFGVAYLLACRWLDRRGHHGVATPFAMATLPALASGVVFLADDLEQAGTGLLILLVGAGVAHHGATLGRRATAWLGGAATAVGAAVFLSDMTDDATVGGMLFLAGGIGLVAAAHALAVAIAEPDELEPTEPGRGAGPRVAVTSAAPAIPPPPGAPGGQPAPADDDLAQWMPPPSETPGAGPEEPGGGPEDEPPAPT